MSFTAALLAGGKSSRMGGDKAFVAWRGLRLLDHQLATLKSLGPAEVLLSGRRAVDYALPGVRVVFDAVPGCGPLGGLAAVLESARCDPVVVLAIDLPAINAAFLQQLLDQCGPHRGAAVRLPHGWEPLAAVYPRAILTRVQTRLARREYSLQALLDDAAIAGLMQPVAVAAPALFRNVNSPADLRMRQP